MSDRATSDVGVEREIDLRVWRDAALAYWWLAVAGLVVGAVLGGLYAYSTSTRSTYMATATIARGQAFSPSGSSIVQSYLTNLKAIQLYATTPQTIDQIAAKVGIPPGELAGHIQASTFTNEGTLSATNTGSVVVGLAVTLRQPKKAEDAANELARIIQKVTTLPYVLEQISLFKNKLAHYAIRLKTLQRRIDSLNAVLGNTHNGLSPVDNLILAERLDSAEAAQGQTLDSQTTAQLQLTLSDSIEKTRILQYAKAVKIPGQSSRKALVVGGVIGLILGAIVAMGYGLRVGRKSPAQA